MPYEVEQKFPVADLAAVTDRLAALEASLSPPQEEVDLYFAHPSVDFAKTDEALRLRRKGEANFLTYKGPKIDAATKTRREIELGLGPGKAALESWTALLAALGFTPLAEVRKTRRKAFVPWQGRQVEASLDTVDRLGTFVELELIAEAQAIEPAKACLASLAQSLGLSGSERRSYLELLLGRGTPR
ncbi:MAG: class IV adenylate cyclase [Thermoguttaceae bacterium]|jgi:adenylate cyclase class 2